MIQVSNLTVRLGDKEALHDVTLRIDRGDLLGLIGPPESGKTVLLKTIAGLIRLCNGEVRADGERVDNLEDAMAHLWRQRIGMSFQNDALFDSLTVFDNVAFPLRRRATAEETLQKRVHQVLARVGLDGAAARLPMEISGGMRKRVGIARAAVIEPELGLYDDPISGLDPASSATILDLIVGLHHRNGAATVVVSNDLPVLLPIVNRVVMLNAGRIVYNGTVEGLTQSDRPEVVQFATGSDLGPL
ncbi:MAG: hypothetical protein A2289_27070 [Deltaproteobacteria bacterium RIFOXYA12_FULL_58_15]|nr:MAG: hypothetical protein A2289_27070 [Deltaproteobacteria bacterium RIFOXYA12_FULL_58_15]OGR09193.1 MAG: hypothetical protein A2341_24470 [Deltaproteobacteria bacterium RIFOXYB12_FULL_58_9]